MRQPKEVAVTLPTTLRRIVPAALLIHAVACVGGEAETQPTPGSAPELTETAGPVDTPETPSPGSS